MASRRPTVILVMAILNIVFGGFWLLFVLCGGFGLAVMAVMPTPPNTPGAVAGAPMIQGLSKVPGYLPFAITNLITALILSVILIVCGIGFIGMKKWARWMALGYSIVYVIFQVASLTYTLTVLDPAMAEVMKDQPFGGFSDSPLNKVVQVGFTGLGIAYAIVLLVIMLLPSVSAAFAGRLPAAEPEMDYYDEPEDPEERRP